MSETVEVIVTRRTLAVAEGLLRYWVPSRRNPRKRYLVDLTLYNGNGLCACPHSQIRCQKLLTRGISPKEAVEKKLIKLKPGHEVRDALRCEHVLEARSQFLDEIIERVVERDRTAQGNTHVA